MEGRCAVEGCDELVRSRGWCNRHYERWRKHGDPGEAERRPKRAKLVTRCLTTGGYVRVFAPDHPMAHAYGWALEHRLVAYDLGLLTGPEDRRHVHHRNHRRDDNRSENLAVVDRQEHGRHHRTIDWDRAVALYEAGATTTEIAAELGTFPGNVSRRLREAGVVVVPGLRHRTPVDGDEVERLVAAGDRCAAIAHRLGVPRGAVERIMRERGLPAFRPGRP